MKNKLILPFLIAILLTNLLNASVYDVAVSSDALDVKKGEIITFEVYILGKGDFDEAHLWVVSEEKAYLNNLSLIERGNLNKNKIYEEKPIPPIIENPYVKRLSFDKDSPLLMEGSNLNIYLETDELIPPGDHELYFILDYKDEDGWKNSKTIKNFHIKTWYEEKEKVLQKLFIIIGIFALIVGFTVGFYSLRDSESLGNDLSKLKSFFSTILKNNQSSIKILFLAPASFCNKICPIRLCFMYFAVAFKDCCCCRQCEFSEDSDF